MAFDAPGPADDAVLLAAARRGDLSAFNGLVLRHQRTVYSVCARTLSSPDDAADATQEAFLSAYRSLTTFRGAAEGFRPWLLRIAVNGCYDVLRRRRRHPSESLDEIRDDPDDGPRQAPPDPNPLPDERALTDETRRQIEAGLATLAPDQRLTVVLCDVQGLSYEEAADVMGVEIGTVKSRLSRARVRLREYLVGKGERPASRGRLDE